MTCARPTRRATRNCSTQLAKDFRGNKWRPEEADSHDLHEPRVPALARRRTTATRATSATTRAHYRQRLRAEVLLDMVSDITGVPEKFEAMPPGSRAIEGVDGSFAVGVPRQLRPTRPEPGPAVRADRRTRRWFRHSPDERPEPSPQGDQRRRPLCGAGEGQKTPVEIVDELYLLAYCRYPSDTERAAAVKRFESSNAPPAAPPPKT